MHNRELYEKFDDEQFYITVHHQIFRTIHLCYQQTIR